MGNFCSCFNDEKIENTDIIDKFTIEENSYMYEDSDDEFNSSFYRLYD